ncbi:LAME_0H01640g1_1 [Lachancea meyersii CBS 8951]|uniref:LAME_0H01640g1_1 n=1 Tax=Lachancea meyersii CBS 8951 TaxID=1266667 RepID=A0A1G4KDH4_9SACH|nr:LAME_0H01640g1_1 [Lachancea meyersii CBS 8951]
MTVQFHRYQERYNSFLQTFNIQGKRCSWPYKVIPTKAMAQSGFEFSPRFKGEILSRDSVRCNFCGGESDDFHNCRSKPLAATLSKVLENHLETHTGCLYSELKLALVKSFWKSEPIDWSVQKSLRKPHSEEVVRLRQWTYKEGWIHERQPQISSNAMAKAGLLRYDLGLSSPELLEEHPDATYCIYCSKIIGSWEANDNPVWEHFVCSNGGRCHFFETMPETELVARMKARYDEEGLGSDEKLLPCLDYYETFASQFSRFEEETLSQDSQNKRGRPRSRGSGELPAREPRKRGRPPKERPADVADVANVAESEIIGPTNGSGEVQPIKRKRGRPRNVVSDSATVIKEKRPRGRPRKDGLSSVPQDQMPNSISPPHTADLKVLGSSGSVSSKPTSASDDNANPASNSQHTIDDVPGIENGADSAPQKLETPHVTNGVSLSPKRKIRLRQNQRMASAEDNECDSDENSTKSIVLNFNNPSPKSNVAPRNPIIDDSFDAFSFSAHGNSEFVIPESAFQTKKSNAMQTLPESVQRSSPSVSVSEHANVGRARENQVDPSFALKNGALNDIDMDVEMSDDSIQVPPLSEASTPIGTPARSSSTEKEQKDDTPPIHDINQSDTSISSTIPEFERTPAITSNFAQSTGTDISPRNIIRPTAQVPQVGVDNSTDKSRSKLATNEVSLAATKGPFGVENDRSLSSSSNLVITDQNIPNEESTAILKLNKSNVKSASEEELIRNGSSPSVSFGDIFPATADLHNSLVLVDEERVLLANYFRKLLRYINVNDLSLFNEVDGDLSFFVQHMPQHEKQLAFSAWIDKKQSELKEEFERDYRTKVAKLDRQFKAAKSFLEKIDNDEALLKIADHYSLLDNFRTSL